MKGFRFQAGSSWAERAEKAQEALSELRSHRGYLALTDMLEGDLRALWRAWLDSDMDASTAERIRQEGILVQKLLANLDGITSREDLQQMQARVYEGFTTDEQMASAHAEALSQAGTTPHGGGEMY